MAETNHIPASNALTTMTDAERLASLMRSLEGWTHAEALPVSADQIAAGIAIATARLMPADPREIAVKLERTMRLWRLPEAWEAVAEFYLEALEDLPPDLLDLALKRVRMSHRYPSAPSPADFRIAVADEMMGRKAAQTRLRSAEFKLRLEEIGRKRLARPEGDAR